MNISEMNIKIFSIILSVFIIFGFTIFVGNFIDTFQYGKPSNDSFIKGIQRGLNISLTEINKTNKNVSNDLTNKTHPYDIYKEVYGK